MSQTALEWWTRFTHDILTDPKLTAVVVELVESDDVSILTSELADRVKQRRHGLDGEAGLAEDEGYGQHTLSSDLERLERHGVVRRVAKAYRDDQSIIFKSPNVTEFLSRQDLQTPAPGDMDAGNACEAEMAYVLETEPEANGPRLSTPLEAAVYAIADEYATLSVMDVSLEHGNPETFSAETEELARRLYEGGGDPLPKFPQHADRPDVHHDYGFVGVVGGVDEVAHPIELETALRIHLFRWTAAAFELYTRQTADDYVESISDDLVSQRANQLEARGSHPARPGLFGTRVLTTGDEVVVGLNLRTDTDAGDDPIGEPDRDAKRLDN